MREELTNFLSFSAKFEKKRQMDFLFKLLSVGIINDAQNSSSVYVTGYIGKLGFSV